MRVLGAICLLLFSVNSPGSNLGPTAIDETARLHAWLDARYEQELSLTPEALTLLGRKESYDQMNDYSEAGVRAHVAWLQESAGAMASGFDYSRLSPEGKISYDFWNSRAANARAELPFLRYNYIFDQNSALHTEFVDFLISKHTVASESDFLAYIARIKDSARGLRQLLQRAKLAASEGIRPPRFAYDSVIDESRKIISGVPFEKDAQRSAPLWADARKKISQLQASGLIDVTRSQELLALTEQALLNKLAPAYRDVIGWLESDLANTAVVATGVGELPNGKAYYERMLAHYTTTDMTADEVHALGLEEVATIRAQMEGIRAQVKFDGDLREFLEFVRSDQQFYFPDTEVGRRTYLDQTEAIFKDMKNRLPAYFGVQPRAEVIVKRVEPYREQPGAAAYYSDGTPDGSRPGIYYLHLLDMAALNRVELQSTAYHEGNPGHHLQGAIALERTDLPLFRTNIWHTAYGEGWALYAEYLAWEMGAFTDPYANFGRLVNEIFRAVRLVVDTGLHARGWTQEQALEYMRANTSSSPQTLRAEVRRYLVWPGQATGYKIGMLKILQLRARAMEAMGDDFDIRRFHDLILIGGSLPLDILERRVNDWISAQSG